jgi:hypothetical protein
MQWVVQQPLISTSMVAFMRESIGKYEFDDMKAKFIELGGLAQVCMVATWWYCGTTHH